MTPTSGAMPKHVEGFRFPFPDADPRRVLSWTSALKERVRGVAQDQLTRFHVTQAVYHLDRACVRLTEGVNGTLPAEDQSAVAIIGQILRNRLHDIRTSQRDDPDVDVSCSVRLLIDADQTVYGLLFAKNPVVRACFWEHAGVIPHGWRNGEPPTSPRTSEREERKALWERLVGTDTPERNGLVVHLVDETDPLLLPAITPVDAGTYVPFLEQRVRRQTQDLLRHRLIQSGDKEATASGQPENAPGFARSSESYQWEQPDRVDAERTVRAILADPLPVDALFLPGVGTAATLCTARLAPSQRCRF